MRAYWQLTLAQLRIFARNKKVLFFTLLFPIILMLALGTFAGNGSNLSLSIGLIDSDQTAASKNLAERFYKNDGVEVKKFKSVKSGKEALKNGDIQLFMEIPKGYEEKLEEQKGSSILPVYYNEKNLTTSELGLTVVNLPSWHSVSLSPESRKTLKAQARLQDLSHSRCCSLEECSSRLTICQTSSSQS